ncbi:hypothetical protein SAMN05216232_0106 [Virgibacillus subterraneus]|uniref:Uncharacterized protein n=1 Tax=Virgibacillus subterraneus TaxID=621109 RepID=A0A1H9L183_9BACI|nr:hypothetical protein SAMN05216232_0106 [Virgibacillus subterraneus]
MVSYLKEETKGNSLVSFLFGSFRISLAYSNCWFKWFNILLYPYVNFFRIKRVKSSAGNTRRFLWEQQQLKIPQEAFFASEESEALATESEVYFWSGVIALEFFGIMSQFISVATIFYKTASYLSTNLITVLITLQNPSTYMPLIHSLVVHKILSSCLYCGYFTKTLCVSWL